MVRYVMCALALAVWLGPGSQGCWTVRPALGEGGGQPKDLVGVTIQDVTLVTGRALKLDPDIVQVAWPAGTRNMRLIHVGLEVNTYGVRYRLAGAGAGEPLERQVECFELHSLDDAVPWHWAIGWTPGQGVIGAHAIAEQNGDAYLAWSSVVAPPAFAPLSGDAGRDAALREQLGAWAGHVPHPRLIYVHEEALGLEVRGASPAVPLTFDFISIEKLTGGGWRVTYYGVDRPIVHTVVYGGKQWRRADR